MAAFRVVSNHPTQPTNVVFTQRQEPRFVAVRTGVERTKHRSETRRTDVSLFTLFFVRCKSVLVQPSGDDFRVCWIKMAESVPIPGQAPLRALLPGGGHAPRFGEQGRRHLPRLPSHILCFGCFL
jgi:hypothetical protein